MYNTKKPSVMYTGHGSEGLLHLSIDQVPHMFKIDLALKDRYLKDIRRNPEAGLSKLRKACHWYVNELDGVLVESGC